MLIPRAHAFLECFEGRDEAAVGSYRGLGGPAQEFLPDKFPHAFGTGGSGIEQELPKARAPEGGKGPQIEPACPLPETQSPPSLVLFQRDRQHPALEVGPLTALLSVRGGEGRAAPSGKPKKSPVSPFLQTRERLAAVAWHWRLGSARFDWCSRAAEPHSSSSTPCRLSVRSIRYYPASECLFIGTLGSRSLRLSP